MRTKIDYGIDLGTTNSAIARMENGAPTIKKSETLKDTIPSCVHFSRKKDVFVGDKAFNVLKTEKTKALKTFETGKTNTFIEFKRTMGTTETYSCAHLDKNLSSEELSAEVLKKLKSFVQDENLSSVVITIPAKFLNPQNEATMRAAKLAGFQDVHLLQEPVAAATAYGLATKNKDDAYWLVFDLGGGTFDAALVKAEEGILSVKDTDGDNWLGGKNLDYAIIDQILIPYLRENYAIESFLSDDYKKEKLRNAVKPFAEEAKIELSFRDTYNVLSDLGELPFEDENGEEPEIDLTLTQQDMEDVLAPLFQQAIDITKGLLRRNNLRGSDLGALILVGGPTYSPVLRKMLREQITEKIDTSVDPMTVVARGAALYASSISVSDSVQESTRDRTKIQIALNYESTTVELDETISIKVLQDQTEGELPEEVYADVARADGAWASDKRRIGEKPTLVDVLLEEGRANVFDVKLYDQYGNQLACQPNQFTILQGIGGLDKMQTLSYHIGIGKWFENAQKDLFKPAKGLEKNKQIGRGIVGIADNLYTRQDIRPGMKGDRIRIPIYQGDHGTEGTNPLLNNLVEEVIITGETMPKLLPKGSPVTITIRADGSSLLKFSADFPTIEHTEELEVEVKDQKTPEESFLAGEIAKAKRTAWSVNAHDVAEKLDELEAHLENERGSADGKLKILDGLRKELLKLEAAEKSASWPKVESELKEAFYELESLVKRVRHNTGGADLNMRMIEASLSEYREKIEHIIPDRDIKAARELISEIGSRSPSIRNAVSGNAMHVQYLHHLNDAFGAYHWKDATKARTLLNQGLQMAANGNTSGIRNILIEVIGLMPNDEKPKETLG